MRQIQLQQIHKEYGDAVILDDISFSVSYGERIGIVGPNGCGKSTLLGILAGWVPADAGSVWMSKKTSLQLLIVSHDRYFLERVCDKALIIKEQQIRRLEYLPVKNI